MVPTAAAVDRATAVTPSLLLSHLDAAGGFTVHRRTGRPATAGISVALATHTFVFARTAWDDAHVADWLRSVDRRRSPWARHLGGWVDPETDLVVLDEVFVVRAVLRRLACRLGRWTGQRFLYDLCHGRTVTL